MHEQNLGGIYHLLSVLPFWVAAPAAWVFFIGIFLAGRRVFEGLAYNVAWSSKWGDLALVGVMAIGMHILKYDPTVPKKLTMITTLPYYQCFALAIGVVVGVVWQWNFLGDMAAKGLNPMVMDTFHNTVIAPVIIFVLLSIAPVIFVCGSRWQITVSLLLAVFWALLVYLDAKTGRLSQQEYLMKNGFVSDVWKK